MSTRQEVVVLFGGTGVIGRELAQCAQAGGTSVLSISLDPDHDTAAYSNRLLDLSTAPPGAISRLLEDHCGTSLRVVTMVDVVGLAPHRIDEVADYAQRAGASVAMVSSSLLYRPKPDGIYDEAAEVVTPDSDLFPYQRLKLAQEQALSKRSDVAWRIFRTNHVIGRGGLLGCIPDHNRDPDLLDRITRGAPLKLARKGKVQLSFVHARDLAEGLLHLCAIETTAQRVMNLVHPVPALASDYFQLLAYHLGAPAPVIEDYRPDDGNFWSLTAADNILVSQRPELDQLRFQFDLGGALRDALQIDPGSYASFGSFLAQRIK
ncbi:NAD(P)-dependent oxidoreductase [Loktanella sp. IMCC34160]|uniref:NAD-dependent epimerase/dehydratase family protein n=1 Tax=Loktanella sp. IMCC34160 TaxID=2510646 RepID=UPI00101D5F93|nr:NAD(P)-dependent oxidoreductase [Loktanella sp. IMCC34160]RYG93100.1 NAD(P)-dependent oxidoreductase [Loktanella sp. IMCC34160]